ncbi:hypothetical protein C3747_9g356 [Trypanosoma cruzi]|uniref:Uncharacterized protein n=2 Tax=Trypanosoma cruzi TaxID=5693 RepID=Q4E395_TRYCC|nr:hypothetical protein, conserved [Trypanosoma cruzi]EAN99275.1 hypothetical protein, conserved [Trypanosoma cruzi]PWV19596.1 hypothetical protein C3747_9g356 [Trypanosoma cruzi]|eukprot:XP_821126.1 hypothetical protein [Trypanosoma cruzi strain CL Brener]
MIDDIEATLNRMLAFPSGASSLDAAIKLKNIALALELAEQIPLLTETCMSLCVELAENTPPQVATVHSVLSLLARFCMREENRGLATRFGVFSLCVLILQDHKSLPEDTIFAVFDLISTLCMNDGNVRRMLRPSIPYIIEIMNDSTSSLQLAFGGAVALATLTMLDADNATLAVERGSVQLLISSFIRAYDRKKEIDCQHICHVSRCKKEEEQQLCEKVMRWSRDALQKLVQSPSHAVDEKLEEADFGKYGSRVEVDELKWMLKFQRRKVSVIHP